MGRGDPRLLRSPHVFDVRPQTGDGLGGAVGGARCSGGDPRHRGASPGVSRSRMPPVGIAAHDMSGVAIEGSESHAACSPSAAFRPWCRPPGLDAPRSDTPKVDFPGVESPALLPFPAVQCNKAYPSRHAYLLRTRLRAARDKPYSLDVIRRLAPHASCLSHSSS